MNELDNTILKILYQKREEKVLGANYKGTHLVILGIDTCCESIEEIKNKILSLKKGGYITTVYPTAYDMLDYAKKYYTKRGSSVSEKHKKKWLQLIENGTKDDRQFFQNYVHITDKGISYLKEKFPELFNEA